MANPPTIAQLIQDGFMRAAKGYKSEADKRAELLDEIAALKKAAEEIKKFSRLAKKKYSQNQLSLLQLDQCVATLQLNITELENSQDNE